jgi:hypothetical protein
MSLKDIERWIAIVRLLGVPFAVYQISIGTGYPEGYRAYAWSATAILAAGAVTLWILSRRDLTDRVAQWVGIAALTFDTVIVSTYVLIYSFERGTPIRQLIFLPISEGALLYGIRGSVALALVCAPVVAAFEWLRSPTSSRSSSAWSCSWR